MAVRLVDCLAILVAITGSMVWVLCLTPLPHVAYVLTILLT
jgi:hypothetical protein